MVITVYKDRDNSFSFTLIKNQKELTLAEISDIFKYEIRYKNQYYNSIDYPSAFSVNGATITINPQSFGLSKSSKQGDLIELIIYSTNYPNGYVWEQFRLIVSDEAEII